MSILITADLGNTLGKVGVFAGRQLIDYSQIEVHDTEALKALLAKHPSADGAILSSVITHDEEWEAILNSSTKKFIRFSPKTPIPIANTYMSPETLGLDRLAAVAGASALYPKKTVLTVDAGTCIKFDLINEKEQYLGGAISPGVTMRFMALHEFTDQLPMVGHGDSAPFIGRNTKESLESGVIFGAVCEIEERVSRFKAMYPNLTVLGTGGDWPLLEKELKNTIFAEPFLVLIGLENILAHNLTL